MSSYENCTGVLDHIRNNLPDNVDLAEEYFLDQALFHAKHPCYQEVFRLIGSLAVQSLTLDHFHSLVARIPDPELIIKGVLEDVHQVMEEKNLVSAEHILSYILPYAYATPETGKETYFAFRDFIEYAYYITHISPDENLVVHPYLGVDILFHQGLLFAAQGNRDRAYSLFQSLRIMSPVNAAVLFELADIFRNDRNLPAYREIIISCFEYAWKAEELAKAYRYMGYYFTETDDNTAAVTCYLMGSTWEQSSITDRELTYIREKAGVEPDIEYIIGHGREILAEREVPFGPNQEIINLMIAYAEECKDEGDLFEARKYLSRAKALELSDRLEQKIEVIERFIEDSTVF